MTKYSCDCGGIEKNVSELNDVLKDLVCPICNSKLHGPTKIAKQTKLQSWLDLKEDELSIRRQSIYNKLSVKPMTDQELTKELGFKDPNKVRPRRKELVDMGLVKENNKRPCLITGKTVTEWEAI